MFFISGITGKVGGAAARQLLHEGHTVRALARDPLKAAAWSQKGVDVRRGDFNDAAAVAGAMEGVEGAFLMLPPFFAPAPGFPEAKAIIASFREALRQAPPPRLVVLSSVGSQQGSGLGHITVTHLLEEALGDLPCPTAFIRAGSFLENYTRGLEAAASTGWFDSYWTPTDRAVPMVATADIGKEVARLLVGGWSGKKIVELGSRTSPDDLARAMSEVLGRPVQARAVPREQWTASLEAQGLPPRASAPFQEMVDSYNSGWIDFGVPGTEPVAGTVTPAQVFEQARKA
ncbi:MAG: NmrA family NAD(P)-binding protein [Gemmatimonadaceae bacterium]